MLPSNNRPEEKKPKNSKMANLFVGLIIFTVILLLAGRAGWTLKDRVSETKYRCAVWWSQTNTVAQDRLEDAITGVKENRAEIYYGITDHRIHVQIWKQPPSKRSLKNTGENYLLFDGVQECDCPYKWWKPGLK